MHGLAARAWIALTALLVATGLVLFVLAGTLRYWQAWVYLAIFGAASALITLYLLGRDRALLERRMRGGPTAEKRPQQKLIMLGTSLCFIAHLAVPALDRRFGWSSVPDAMVAAGAVLVTIGFALIARVYRENSFTSATVEIAPDQRVITSGPYALVRHPMYASALLYLLGTPLVLGSYWGLVPFAVVIPLLIWRLLDEEQLLARNLPGYTDYQQRVRRRLVPFVW
jgi:protein-S-isoprenylcysteine O-methyltransferase Ste14